MAVTYSDEHKRLAKTIAVMYSPAKAQEFLREVWAPDEEMSEEQRLAIPEQVPAERTIQNWKNDPRVPVDEELMSRFTQTAKRTIVASIPRLLGPIEQLILDLVAKQDALGVKNATVAYGILTDKLSGPLTTMSAQGPGGGMQFFGPTYLSFAPRIEEPKPAPEYVDIAAREAKYQQLAGERLAIDV